MSTKTLLDNSRIGQNNSSDSVIGDLTYYLGSSCTIGIDQDGYHHHYFGYSRTVVVYDGRDLDDAYHLDWIGPVSLRQWIGHVEERRGWLEMGSLWRLAMRIDEQHRGSDP